MEGWMRNNMEAGVLEPSMGKVEVPLRVVSAF